MKALLPLMFLIGAGVSFFYFTDPVIVEIKNLQARKAELERGLKNAADLNSQIDKLIIARNAITERQLDRLGKLLPSQVDNVRLTIEMGRIGSRGGMPLRNVSVNVGSKTAGEEVTLPSGSGSELNEVSIAFDVSGSYALFKSFMATIADNLRLLDVKAFSVNAGDSDFYDYHVELTTHWFNEFK